MLSERDVKIFRKALRVIWSCETITQLIVALQYVRLVLDNMSTEIRGVTAVRWLLRVIDVRLLELQLKEVS